MVRPSSRALKPKLSCTAVEAETKRAYLSCPKAKLRYECPLCRTHLGPNKLSFTTHIQLHTWSEKEDQVRIKIVFAVFCPMRNKKKFTISYL